MKNWKRNSVGITTGLKKRVNAYAITTVTFATLSDSLNQTSNFTANGSQFALFALNLYVPTVWPATDSELFSFKTSGGATRVFINFSSSGRLTGTLSNIVGITVASFTLSTSELAANTWYTLLFSLDTTIIVKRWQIYKRPATGSWTAVTPASSFILDSGIIDNCGRLSVLGNAPACDLADIWLTMTETLDLSNATNRDKFLPNVNKGAAGAIPTGTSPAVFLSGAISSWHINKGTGRGLTKVGAGQIISINGILM